MKKLNYLMLAVFALTGKISMSQNYIPDAAFTNDYYGRVGHSNSNLTTPASAGFMESPKHIVQVGNYVYVVGRTLDDTYGGGILNKKNAINGSNVSFLKLNYGLLLNGTMDSDELLTFSLTYDAGTDRLYLTGNTTTSNKGFILCFKQSTLTLDPTFDGDGIQLFQTGTRVMDLVVSNSTHMVAVVNSGNEIQLIELVNGGQWSAFYTLSSPGKTYSANRIKIYPGLTNRFYITGYVNQSGTYSPAIWGVDMVYGPKGTLPYFSLVCNNALELSMEGPGEFKDLCFPFNTTTNKYDIVCVGKNVVGAMTSATSGIYIKYKGNMSVGPPFNLAIDNSFKNQSTIPGKGIANNMLPTPNMTVFSGCEVLGDKILVVGSYGITGHSPHDAIIGTINSTGTQYNKVYTVPIASVVVHYPGRVHLNASNQIFLVGCDFGLTSVKLIPN